MSAEHETPRRILAVRIPITGPTEPVWLHGGNQSDLDTLQEAVAGYIEAVDLDEHLVMFINEEGHPLLRNLPSNSRATDILAFASRKSGMPVPLGGNDLRGDVVLVGMNDMGENADIPTSWRVWLQNGGYWPGTASTG